ncbi:MAG: phosphonate ABC transporter ATP-binding protein [Aquificaceae bacterium]|nr:phosphonate ABC transporter ATP-binding protein [Aquificaceae bacterium]
MRTAVVDFEGVSKSFGRHVVLKEISLRIEKGSMTAIIGPSGSGKTTLVSMINGFVAPSTGRVLVEGRQVNYKNPRALKELRKRVGMVYQLFNLVDRLTALQNVLTGALGRYDKLHKSLVATLGFFSREDYAKAMELLDYVGLADKAYHRVDKLSGGQKQRVAIARALMQEPAILLADEPIANLDPKTSRRIMDLFAKINKEKGITVICVLHHVDILKDYFDRIIAVSEGSIYYDGPPHDLDEDLLKEIYKFEEEEALV